MLPGDFQEVSGTIGNNDLRAVLPDMCTPHVSKPSVRGGEVQVSRVWCPTPSGTNKRNWVSTVRSEGDDTYIC